MSVTDVLREAEEESAIEAARLVLLGKAPVELLRSYAPPSPLDPLTPKQRRRLKERWPTVPRLVVAFRLARDVDACADLLAGRPVDRDRLDPEGVRWARSRMLVSLAPAADLLGGAL